MATLYELSGNYAQLMSELNSAESDEEAEVILSELDQAAESLSDKAEAYAKMLMNAKAEAEAYKAEKDRLAAKQKRAENTMEYLKRGIQNTLTLLGERHITTSIGTWHLVRNPISVQITDESKVPADFRVPQPDRIDKKGLLNHYKETGEIVEGTDIVESEGVRFR